MNVSFVNTPTIHTWSDDEDRHSQWVVHALDRRRFQRRIKYMEHILAPVLLETHREKVFRKHFESFLVIDIQGFFNQNFIPKEISISDGKRSIHLLFKPIVPFRQLPQRDQREVIWLEKNYLNINYRDGYVELKYSEKILSDICKHYNKIYVKGNQKADFLSKYVNVTIINLEHLQNVPNLVKTNSACFYHSKNNSMCTERNVEAILNYLL